MARLKKEVVATREQFVRDLYVKNPTMSVKDVQAALVAEFGSKMRPARLSELLTESLAGGTTNDKALLEKLTSDTTVQA